VAIKFDEILLGEDPDPDYLIDGLIYAGQTLIVAGEPGVGKSFLQYYIAMCVASGLPVLGRDTKSGKVLYFDEENSRPDLAQYLRWIWRGLECPPIDRLQENMIIEHFSLASAKSRWMYMSDLAKQLKPKLIVVDTVTPCCGIDDENSNSEASHAIRNLRAVRQQAGAECSIVLLKHAKFSHDPSERQSIRGAKTWIGETDGTLFHKRMLGRPRGDDLYNSILTPDKVRAFGLRRELVIQPDWTGGPSDRGVKLAQGQGSAPKQRKQD
jgi:RecA-family ATPase